MGFPVVPDSIPAIRDFGLVIRNSFRLVHELFPPVRDSIRTICGSVRLTGTVFPVVREPCSLVRDLILVVRQTGRCLIFIGLCQYGCRQPRHPRQPTPAPAAQKATGSK